MQRSQEARGCAPRTPAAARRGLQTGPGGRGGGSGSSCSSRPLPHPCRPRAAALKVRRGPSRRSGGAGAVVRVGAAVPEREWRRAQGSGSGSVRACGRVCQSRPRPRHSLRGVEAERLRVRHGGRPYWKRARATGSRRKLARGGARPWAPPPRAVPWGSAAPLYAPEAVGPNPSTGSQRPTAPPARRGGAAQPQPVTAAPRAGGARQLCRVARTYDGGTRFAEAVTAITWRPGSSPRSRRVA